MDKHPIQYFIVRTLVKQAITFEEQTIKFYQRAAERVTLDSSKTLLLSFAEEEQKHKHKLEQFISGDFHEIMEVHPPQEQPDLTIETPHRHRKIEDIGSEKELIELAVMKEKASYSFYLLLSQRTKIHSAKQVFLYLAQQEQSHLHKLEAEMREEKPG